jgi:methyl-accepting chemotaxis protein
MNPRQLGVPLALVAMGFIFSFAAQSLERLVPQLFIAIGIAAAGAVLVTGGGQKGPALGPLVDALRAAGRGKRPRLPEGATGELAEAYEQIDQVATRHAELTEEVKKLEENAGGSSVDVAALAEAAARAAKGERARVPAGAEPEVVQLYGELGTIAERLAAAEGEARAHKSEAAQLAERLAAAENEVKARRAEAARELADLVEATMHAAAGDRVRAPSGASAEVSRMYGELSALAERFTQAEQRDKTRRSDIAQASAALEDSLPRLSDGVANTLHAGEQATEHIREMTTALANIAQSIESLASSAEESSSSILQMTATNDETAENVGELASSVRETVSSIEEMAYSIREVAKNVDALSLTAEETSSSMNEMDVSIDQVQSNANETARLSEEVATDAEKGAEAILKTIGEIYRIKESSQEAVAVISNLGFRIEAIGQILAVIDDVAEQTNLLALNAAIIAAQAGEHGKGFAVVADEIKDLAERAGGSTKEIAELIKTIQSESKNAIAAVERGAHNVDRGVEVSNEAERALKKILESSQKSTNMVRAIARATVEQAKGSKQVTDAIGRIAETVQQIAAATAEQARGSELIMKSAEKMRTITQHVERSSQEQARGGRQITSAIEQISNMVNSLNSAQRTQMRGGEQLLDAGRRIEEATRMQEQAVRQLMNATERLRRALA